MRAAVRKSRAGAVVTGAVVIAVIAVLAVIFMRGFEFWSAKDEVSVRVLEEAVRSASDLTTTSYFYKDLGEYEKHQSIYDVKVPLTTDQYIYTYNGTIKVGIDISEIKFSVDNANKKIKVTCPELKVVSHEIDNSSILERKIKDSVFTKTTSEDVMKKIAEAQAEQERSLMANEEFINTAQTYTENVLKSFLTIPKLTDDYTFTFKFKDK